MRQKICNKGLKFKFQIAMDVRLKILPIHLFIERNFTVTKNFNLVETEKGHAYNKCLEP